VRSSDFVALQLHNAVGFRQTIAPSRTQARASQRVRLTTAAARAMPSWASSRACTLAPWLATLPAQAAKQHSNARSLLPKSSIDARQMFAIAAIFAAAPLVIALYAYAGYPLILWIVASVRPRGSSARNTARWPSVTITVPVYNALSSIGATLESLLELDYPRDRLQILVISDASTDRTDDVVRRFAERGVELLRLPERRGKTAAENAALTASRGEILVNVDSTILIPAESLKKLVGVFDDPTIGVASGRDVSVGTADNHGTFAESGYVGYEMWVRDLETRVGSIVGASGCFYGSRRHVHGRPLPPGLSWDFAAALVARKQGYRSVSVPAAICIVPRSAQIRTELRRKVRTMARGLSTLFYHRELMNPLRYGGFALMLISHKLLRWLPYLLAPIAYVALCLLAVESVSARALLGVLSAVLIAGIVGIRHRNSAPARPVALAGFVVAVFSAGFLAWWEALRQTQMATWEPTPRPGAQT
jgi:glycosyltransferase involved in cell wall biosynthesis